MDPGPSAQETGSRRAAGPGFHLQGAPLLTEKGRGCGGLEGDSRGTMKGAGKAAAGLEVGEGRWRWFQESEAWGEVRAGMGTEGREAWGGQQG